MTKPRAPPTANSPDRSLCGARARIRVNPRMLPGYLQTLESSGLLRLAQIEPDLVYLFRRALVQEAAYESLLRQDRRSLHLAVGETLERLNPERPAALAPVLAHHFDVGGDEPRALDYLIQ